MRQRCRSARPKLKMPRHLSGAREAASITPSLSPPAGHWGIARSQKDTPPGSKYSVLAAPVSNWALQSPSRRSRSNSSATRLDFQREAVRGAQQPRVELLCALAHQPRRQDHAERGNHACVIRVDLLLGAGGPSVTGTCDVPQFVGGNQDIARLGRNSSDLTFRLRPRCAALDQPKFVETLGSKTRKVEIFDTTDSSIYENGPHRGF